MTSVEPIDTDRRYVSQFSPEVVGLAVLSKAGAPLDPDGSTVTATYFDDNLPAIIRTAPAERLDIGKYALALTTQDVGLPGNYSVLFDYLVSGIEDRARVSLVVGQNSPDYDALLPGMKDVVEQVWLRFADLYDSPNGGPHLQTYVQTRFGRNRLAQLLRTAVGRLNLIAQPHMTYGLDLPFDFMRYGALLEMALYLQVVKHLVISYTEQPEVMLGTQVSRLDRRDYSQRWEQILSIEEEDFKRMMSGFKMDHMGLGNVRVLVSGGIFGHYGGAGWGMTGGGAAARGLYAISRAY